jgi:hypothetical protein
MRKYICILTLCMAVLVAHVAKAQKPIVTYGTIIDGDTIPVFVLDEVQIRASYTLLTPQEIKNNQRLIRNVKKMLPYAKEGRRRMDILERQCEALKPRQRKALIKQAEKDLLADYTAELKQCTISQGKVLLKLIDRETGSTSYMIVDELRGRMRAAFYQTFAKVFGYNMKERYNPRYNSEDDLIERICLSVEQGKL